MEKIVMIVRSRAKPGERDRVRRLFEQHLAPRAVANDAQELVIWATEPADPDAFLLVEVYRDRQAMEANAGAPWFWEYMAAAAPLLDGQPEVITGTPAWEKGI
jgi:quinol monooxygenase YgiN